MSDTATAFSWAFGPAFRPYTRGHVTGSIGLQSTMSGTITGG